VSYSIRHLPLLTNNLPNRCYTPLWYSRQPGIATASLATAAARTVIRARPLNSTVLWDEGEAGRSAAILRARLVSTMSPSAAVWPAELRDDL
jgi:hypothetical protein